MALRMRAQNASSMRFARRRISSLFAHPHLERSEDEGRDGGEFLAFSWQRVTFALRVPKPDASAARMKEQKPQREVGVRAEASAWDN